MRCHIQYHMIKTTYFSTKHMQELTVDLGPSHSSPIQKHTEKAPCPIPFPNFDLIMKDCSLSTPGIPTGDWCGVANTLVFPPMDSAPSFLSPFAARTYQCVLKITFPDIRHKSLKLNILINLLWWLLIILPCHL